MRLVLVNTVINYLKQGFDLSLKVEKYQKRVFGCLVLYGEKNWKKPKKSFIGGYTSKIR